ncbi:MAG: S41 family peptidase [Paludibacteraceae bacterium]
MKKNYLYILLALSAVLSACRDHSSEIYNPNSVVTLDKFSNTYEELFYGLWQGIDQSYIFWDIDTVDWDARWEAVHPMVQQLDRQDSVSNQEIQDALRTMAHDMIDGHLSIGIWNKTNRYLIEYGPQDEKVAARPDYHNQVSYKIQMLSLFSMHDAGLLRADKVQHSVLNGTDFLSAVIDESIPYLHFSGFAISQAHAKGDEALHAFFQSVKTLHDQGKLKAIIIDCRDNVGGAVDDVHYLFGYYLSEEKVFKRQRNKTGLGHYDFGAWQEFSIIPQTGDSYYVGDLGEIPIVYLQNMHSVSMAEVSANFVSSLPNGVTIGERSFGGTGCLNSGLYDNTWTGPFNYLGNYPEYDDYYYAYTCTWQVELPAPDGTFRSLEGYGHTPDIECPLDVDALLNSGEDNQLLRALKYIYQGK